MLPERVTLPSGGTKTPIISKDFNEQRRCRPRLISTPVLMARTSPKIQILTIEGLLDGRERPRYPDLMFGGLMFNKAQREKREEQHDPLVSISGRRRPDGTDGRSRALVSHGSYFWYCRHSVGLVPVCAFGRRRHSQASVPTRTCTAVK